MKAEFITKRDYILEEIIEIMTGIMLDNENVCATYHKMIASELLVPEDLSDPLFLLNCIVALHNSCNHYKELALQYARLQPAPQLLVLEEGGEHERQNRLMPNLYEGQ